jgi:serine phosphatase RsbU (regulator of sigma subunit)
MNKLVGYVICKTIKLYLRFGFINFNMVKFFSFLLCFLFPCAVALAQNTAVIEKLQKQYAVATADTTKIMASQTLYQSYKQQAQYAKALEYLEIFKQTEDSLFNIEKAAALTKLETKSIIDKKDLQIKQQEQEKKLQQYWNYGITAGFFIAVATVFFVWRMQKKEEEAKNLLANQKEEIERSLEVIDLQRNDLHQKNNAIVSSINYARRIQTALLPQREIIHRHLPNLLIYYRPRDIVSGDFYWFSKIAEKEVIVAIADCTGHGVPGALMTVIGNNLLDQIINKDKIQNTAQILTELDGRLLKTLQQQGIKIEIINDGMDIALFKINFDTKILTFSGAKRPLWIFGQGQTAPTEYKGDKLSIGSDRFKEKVFTEKNITLNQGDTIYSFTDGYADQFGTEGKMTIRKFRSLLQKIYPQDFASQEKLLHENLQTWKGNEKQTDDILVMGIRI